MMIAVTTRGTRVNVQVGRQGSPGPMGPIGSFTPAGVLVYDYTDLPSPVGGVITLAPTLYEFMASVVLPDNVRVEAPSDVAIIGRIPGVTKLLGNYDGPLVTFVSPVSGTGHLRDIRVENLSSGTSASAIRMNSATGVLSIADCFLKGAIAAIDISAAASMKIIGCSMISTASNSKSVQITGSVSALVFEFCQWQTAGSTGRLISIEATAIVGSFSAIRCGLIFTNSTQIGIYADALATVTFAAIERVIRFGAPGVINSGWNQTTPQWITLSVDTLPDSATGGGSTGTGPFTVTFPSANTYVPISPASGNPWVLEADSERFTLVSTATGRIKYVGLEPRKFLLIGSMSASKSGAAHGSKIGIFIQNVLHSGNEGQGDVTNRITSRSTAPGFTVLQPNDEIELRVMNTDAADSFSIAGASFTAIAVK